MVIQKEMKILAYFHIHIFAQLVDLFLIKPFPSHFQELFVQNIQLFFPLLYLYFLKFILNNLYAFFLLIS